MGFVLSTQKVKERGELNRRRGEFIGGDYEKKETYYWRGVIISGLC